MKKVLAVLILMIVFNEGYSQDWGLNNSRTEIRDDAGLRGDAGAKSGFFQTVNPKNYPTGASQWWHLLDVRHSNTVNNFAMQFSGSFFDQNLYFRKVQDNPAQPWSKVLTEDPDGDVGIGTTDPRYPLDIKSSAGFLLNLESSASFSGFMMRSASALKQMGMYFIGDSYQKNSLRIARYTLGGYGWEAAPIMFDLGAPHASLVMNDAGYVGIGTPYPSEMLSVKGNIRAKKVIVSQTNWPDYVFESSYKLPSLDSISSFIRANKHLPEMPSAAAIEKDGQDIGEIQKLLLKKVEELTLYVIELKKENNQLKEEIEILKSQR